MGTVYRDHGKQYEGHAGFGVQRLNRAYASKVPTW